ncbi:hypothetical protein PTTG_04634 [Puccinia triticina 1-1 BBBD Race 1]|uniref:DUF4211 domain-containing protein n=1 Tax=Puccinia triticina (isolate 1-1 / race 1 (BBBD)) TaxID=630390 RepID=A0A180GRY7_PUCT1|nr:hypothetical protein PTTG_04634 [Puccinia triticina 1-1 BBBD Race 1]
MNRPTSKRKKPPASHAFKLVIPCRPDLDRFKPADGKIFDDVCRASDDLGDPIEILNTVKKDEPDIPKAFASRPSDEIDAPVEILETAKKNEPDFPKPSSSKKIKSNQSSPIAVVKPKRRASLPESSKPGKNSKPVKKHRARSVKKKSTNPAEDPDRDDLDYSEKEEVDSRLRQKEPPGRKKFAKLRKLRSQLIKKKSISKEVNSKRIVPDSDIEIESGPGKSTAQVDDSDDEDSEDDSSGSGSGDSSSETDEEERKRKEAEFIVDDLRTKAQKKRAQRQIETFMPDIFKNTKLDNRSHFRVVCEYLIYHSILPQIEWRKIKKDFDNSCKHLDDYFNSHGVQALDSAGWTQVFRNELMSRPFITEQPLRQARLGCAACRNRTKYSKKVIQLQGKPYSPDTLKPLKPKQISRDSSSDGESEEEEGTDESSEIEDGEDEGKQHKFKLNPDLMQITPECSTLASGEDCAKRSKEYHFFKHWKFYLLKDLKPILKPHRDKNAILRREYQHSDPEPNDGQLGLIEREIRKAFQTIQADQTHQNLDNLFHRFNTRLNQAKKTYAT